MKERAEQIAEELQPDLLEFCKKAVAARSDTGKEKDMAELVSSEMKKLGYDEAFIDDWGNVVGIVKGDIPGPAIMCNGHMDAVAPGDYNSWGGYDPYVPVIDESEIENPFTQETETVKVIHGRGSADLKCNLCSQIYAGGVLARLKAEGMSFKGTFLLAAVILEENGDMMGTIKLCEDTLAGKGIETDAMICCEPSGLRMMLGHRGRMEIKVEVYGRSCHGSSPWLGINAVEKSAVFIQRVKAMMDKNTLEDEHLGKPSLALTMYECLPNRNCIVPEKAVMVFDRRLVPGETVKGAIEEFQGVIDEIAAEDPEFRAEVSVNKNTWTTYTGLKDDIENSKEVWIIDREHPFIQACAKALKELGEPVVFDYWAFSTDAPQLGSVMHKPVIGFGPGQEYLIHTTEEKVRLDFIEKSLYDYVFMYLNASELGPDELKL